MATTPTTPIHPRVVPSWLYATLTNFAAGLDARLSEKGHDISIDERVYPRNSAPRATQNADQRLFPFVAYHSNDPNFMNAMEGPILKDVVVTVVFVMWYPSLPDGWSLEEYCAEGSLALQECLSGVSDPNAIVGVVHSCEIVGEIYAVDGQEGFEVCEMGYQFKIYAN